MGSAEFYNKIRVSLFAGKLSPEQVEVIEAILKACEEQGVADPRFIAYMLATTYHECYDWDEGTAGRMVQLKEKGGDAYLKSHDYYPYYGRGPSHLTWKYNYEKEGKRLGLDLVKMPGLMLDLEIGAKSHVYCMVNGTYTGHRLSDFIAGEKCDFSQARKIINPKDFKTFLPVAQYATKFLNALT